MSETTTKWTEPHTIPCHTYQISLHTQQVSLKIQGRPPNHLVWTLDNHCRVPLNKFYIGSLPVSYYPHDTILDPVWFFTSENPHITTFICNFEPYWQKHCTSWYCLQGHWYTLNKLCFQKISPYNHLMKHQWQLWPVNLPWYRIWKYRRLWLTSGARMINFQRRFL